MNFNYEGEPKKKKAQNKIHKTKEQTKLKEERKEVLENWN